MKSLRDLLDLEACRVMFSGGPKRLFRVYAGKWFRGKKVVANALPFELSIDGCSIVVGNPFNEEGDAYLITNPLKVGDELYRWLSKIDRLTVLYEERYVGTSIKRLKLRKYLDYLIAYRMESVGREVVNVYELDSGKVTEVRTFVRSTR